MKADRESLDTQQCLRLMGGMAVGRVVYTLDAMPAVLPVRFRIDPDGTVVLEVGATSELVKAVDGAVIGFETGELNSADGSGWSVTVLGRAAVAPAPATGPGQVTANDEQVQIRLFPEVVTGRRMASVPAARPLP